MPLDLSRLASELEPTRTVLFFGSGACIPSHAPTVDKLIEIFEGQYGEPSTGYSLREYAGILENKFGRKSLIETLRKPFKSLAPTGSLLNIPLYSWKSIYTTNYDTLLEQCYERRKAPLVVYESNFDFTVHGGTNAVSLFKLHGSIDKDISDGHSARLILTDSDYDHTQSFREGLYDRFKSDLFGANLVIIGHSLADEDIKSIANRAAEIVSKTGGSGKIVLLMYTRDENRAALWEKRGIQVCFGGIDDFFSAIANKLPYSVPVYADSGHPFDRHNELRPITIEVAHSVSGEPNVNKMFNGWPATYSDIQSGLTFQRGIAKSVAEYLSVDENVCATILGASGLGKTTAARQSILQLHAKGFFCWEHKDDFQLSVKRWHELAKTLQREAKTGVLFVDEAHSHLHELNVLLDSLNSERIKSLKIILCSSKNHWNPRVKTPAFYKIGHEFTIRRLDAGEIDGLLNLVDSCSSIGMLVGDSFSGFSRYERRRRLVERCESETFVCLKNVFATEKFDDIILREYASLDEGSQEIYKIVAAMESSGIRVHRQLIIRLLGIPAATIASVLSRLTDIVHEYTINEREGLYGWRGRHNVIVSILTKYKFQDIDQIVELFEKVIDSVSPSYDIEIRTIRELCNVDTGLPRIPDKDTQNRLLRKLISIAPGERVPRHRLIHNLIDMGDFEKAEGEIRIFEKDFNRDPPVIRYQLKILIGRALDTPGIMTEDRVAILTQARDAALTAISRIPDHKLLLGVYCEIGIEIYKLTGDYAVYDDAITHLKVAESTVGDPDISKIIRRYERRMAGQNEISEMPLGEDSCA